MKPRKTALLALLLILTLLLPLFPALPVSAAEIEGETVETYNSFYVQDGLDLQMDFFLFNDIWGESAEGYDLTDLTSLNSFLRDPRILVYASSTAKYARVSSLQTDTQGTAFTLEDGYLNFSKGAAAGGTSDDLLRFSGTSYSGTVDTAMELSARFIDVGNHRVAFRDIRLYWTSGTINGVGFNWGGYLPSKNSGVLYTFPGPLYRPEGAKTLYSSYSLDPLGIDCSSELKNQPGTLTWNLSYRDPEEGDEGYEAGGFSYYKTDGTVSDTPMPAGKHDEWLKAEMFVNGNVLDLSPNDSSTTALSGYNEAIPGANAMTKADSQIGYYGSVNMDIYAVRFYTKTLTSEEAAKNHLADICKYYRLNMDALLAVENEDALKSIYAAFSDVTYGETTDEARKAMQKKLDEKVAEVLYGVLVADGEPAADLLALAKTHGLDLFELTVFPAADRLAIYEAFEGTALNDKTALQELFDTTCESVLSTVYADYLTFEGTEGGLAEATTSAAVHFQSLALQYDLNLEVLASLSETVKERVYLSFADYHILGYYHRAILQKTLADTVASYQELYYGENHVTGLVSFEGYQLLLVGGTGMRAVYSYDAAVLEALEEEGYQVTFGILRAADNRITSLDDVTVSLENGTPVKGEKVADITVAYTTSGGFQSAASDLKAGELALEYRSAATGSDQVYMGFATVKRGTEDAFIYYIPALAEHFEQTLSVKDLATYCKENLAMAYPGIQDAVNGAKGTDISIYIEGDWLCEFRFASSVKAADREAINEVIEEYQGVPLPDGTGTLTVSVSEEPPEGKTGAGFAVAKGSLTLYYDADTTLADALEALAAALGEPDGEIHWLF